MSVGVATMAVYAVTFVRDISLAGIFGRGAVFEAYLLALLLPMTVASVLAGASEAAVLPAYMRLMQAGDRDDRARYVSSLALVSLALGAALIVVLAALGPWMGRRLLAPSNPAVSYIGPISVLLSPLGLFAATIPLIVSVLNAARRFWVTSLAPAAVPLAVLVGLVFALALGSGSGRDAIWVLGVSTLAGTAVQAAFLILAVRRTERVAVPRWHGFSSEIRRTYHAFLPVLAGSFLMTGSTFVDQAMAASLPPGSLAALSYAGKVVTLVSSAGAIAVSTAAFPEFSRLLAADLYSEALSSLGQIVRLLLLIGVPVAVLIYLLSQPLVQIIFQRGAFTPHDTSAVAGIQAMYALQIPWYVAGMVVVRFLAALGSARTILAIATANLVLKVVLNVILMRILGPRGLALSTSIVYFSSFCICLRTARHQLKIRSGGR